MNENDGRQNEVWRCTGTTTVYPSMEILLFTSLLQHTLYIQAVDKKISFLETISTKNYIRMLQLS